MAIIQKLNLFSWTIFHNDSQNLGDLERLKLVIETMPDEKLMRILSSTLYNFMTNTMTLASQKKSFLSVFVA